jgi:hypothetical protein
MIVLDAIPKEIQVITQFSMSQLLYLKLILDNMTFNYDGTNSRHVEAKNYLEQELYPAIEQLMKNVNENGIGPNTQ